MESYDLGLREYVCAKCGKTFWTRARKSEYAYTSRTFKQGHVDIYCSYRCMRAAEKETEAATEIETLEPQKAPRRRSNTSGSKQQFMQLLDHPGVWRNVADVVPDRRRVVAVKLLYHSTDEIYLTVAQFVPRGETRITRNGRIYLTEDTWLTVGNRYEREFHNVIEWYDSYARQENR